MAGRNKRAAEAYLASLIGAQLLAAATPLLDRMHCFILDGRELVQVRAEVWAEWFETAKNRLLWKTDVGDDAFVSTVFLGLDHNYFGEGPPIVFETMIFHRLNPPKTDLFGHVHEWNGVQQWRYSTYEEAEEGHAKAIALFEAGSAPPSLDDEAEPLAWAKDAVRELLTGEDEVEPPPESGKVVH